MGTSEYGQFTCEFCGKPYPWKPQFAGKKVRCECGEVIVAPDQPPASHHQSNDFEEYDLADEPTPANKPGTPMANSPTPTKLVHNGGADEHPLPPPRSKPRAPAHSTPAATSPTLAYQPAPNSRQQPNARGNFANQIGGAPWREIYLPGGLVLLSLVMNIILFARLTGGNPSVGHVLLPLGLALLFNLILSFTGVLLVSRWFEISFGHPGTAILKLSAIVLVPSALAGFAALALGSADVWTMMGVRLIIVMPMTIIGLVVLFSLALDEAFYCMAVIYLVTQWATLFLVSAIATEPSDSNTAAATVLQAGTRPTTDEAETKPQAP